MRIRRENSDANTDWSCSYGVELGQGAKAGLEIDKKYNTARSVTPGASSGTAYVPGTSKYTAAANITPKRTVTAAAKCRHAHGGPGAEQPGHREPASAPCHGVSGDSGFREEERLLGRRIPPTWSSSAWQRGSNSVPSMAFHYHYDAEAENKRMEESRAEADRLTAEIAARKNNLYQLQRDEKRSALETGAPSSPAMLPRAQRRN